jgi:acetyl/propionyl-CoA carboxylase alpha subunit
VAATGDGFERLLIANRGQVAIRVARAAGELGTAAIAVYSRDDAGSLHVRRADEALALDAEGPSAYLDGAALVAAALDAGCDAVHPGYGFLSESAGFARACAAAGLALVGPSPEVLDLFGDKAAARQFAAAHGIPTIPGSDGPASVEEAAELLAGLGAGGAIAIKAIAGGGGRGMRIVTDGADVAAAFERAGAEATRAFGRGELYVEAYRRSVRHVEVQVLGDRAGAVTHLWERDCSLQRHHQKVVEIAPCRALAPGLRTRLIGAALELCRAAELEGLGTVEFLLDAAGIGEDDGEFAFIEVNPRLQVEHPVTEAISGRDLVRTQIELAAGATLAELGLGGEPEPPRGIAIELRVSLEPGGGEEITAFEPPTGGGIRVETDCFAGHVPNPAFDPLLVKAIVHAESGWEELLARARRALAELRIEGVATNAPSLAQVLEAPDLAADRIDTAWLEARLGEWDDPSPARATSAGTAVLAGVRGTLLSLAVAPGDEVAAGATIAVVEAMKMEHLIAAPAAGTVLATPLAPGAAVEPGDTLAEVEPGAVGTAAVAAAAEPIDAVRPDLAALLDRRALTADEARPEAIARRHAGGHRSARENIADLVDPGSFREYGALALPSQGTRRSRAELLEGSPADGLVAGLAAINGERFEAAAARAMVLAYDQTVFAGTQGVIGHRKAERLFELAERLRLPLVLFAEGGGGRPGDVRVGPTGFDMTTFIRFGRLSGVAPLVGIASRYCFAGNAALLGCCDVIIATADASIGMGGPAMVEAGGLGAPAPAAIGPASTSSFPTTRPR